MSIALEVCRMAEEQAGLEGLGSVITVGIEVGDDAGVEPESLRFCLEVLLSSPPFRAARPHIIRGPGDELRLSYLELDDDGPCGSGGVAGPGSATAATAPTTLTAGLPPPERPNGRSHH